MCWESYEQSEERIRAAELARQREETAEQEPEPEETDERVLVSAA